MGLIHNGATPKIEIDAETYAVTADASTAPAALRPCCHARARRHPEPTVMGAADLDSRVRGNDKSSRE